MDIDDVVAEVAARNAEAREEWAGRTEPTAPRWQPTKLSYTHEDCIDYIIANPRASKAELAARYGYSLAAIALITNSDLFQARLAERRTELIDPVLSASIQERFAALTVASLEVLQEKLSLPAHQVSDQLALQAARLGRDALAIGVAPPPPPSAGLDSLATLADRLVGFVRKPPQGVVDVEAREVPPRAV